jgi:DNA-directed RNA polymerase specialized sigma24 family protein
MEPDRCFVTPLHMIHLTDRVTNSTPAGTATDRFDLDQAFVDCFRVNYSRFVRLAFLIIGNQSSAEDCTQDAFETVHRRWTELHDPPAYARTVVVNNARRMARRSATERRLLPWVHRTSDAGPPADPLTDALSSLTVRQRSAVVLRYYDDCSEVEIAGLLKCAPGTVKSLLSRSLAQLRVALDDSGAEFPLEPTTQTANPEVVR